MLLCSFVQEKADFSAGILGPMSEEFCRDRQSIRCPVEARVPCFCCCQDERASTKHRMEGLSRHSSPLIGRKNPAKC